MSHISENGSKTPYLSSLFSHSHIGMGTGKAAKVVAVTGVSGYIGRY